MKRGKCLGLILLLMICATLTSCPDKKGAVVEQGEPLGAVEISQESLESGGLVVYLTGTVTVSNASGEKALNIGDMVFASDTLLTGAQSFCEIQIGDTAVVRVDESTILDLASITSREDKTDVRLGLKSGSVLCKVEKMLKTGDSFKVQTESVVCGVRGTQFSVSSKNGSETILAVRKGKVAMAAPVLDQIQTAASADGDFAAVLDDLDQTVVLVAASEQVTVDPDTFRETDTALSPLSGKIAALDGKGTDSSTQEEIRKLALQAMESVTRDKKGAETRKTALSSDKSRELEQSDDMVMVKTGKDASSSLYKMVIVAEPATAAIEVDGVFAGKGSFSRVYPEGTVINLNISKPGYETGTLSLSVGEKSSRIQTVRLKKLSGSEGTSPVQSGTDGDNQALNTSAPVEDPAQQDKGPISISLKTTPEDAEITINGEKQGKGSFTGEFPADTVLEITVTRNGYESKSLSLTVGAGVTENLVELDPKPIEARFAVTREPGIGTLISKGNTVYLADAAGVVYAVSASSGVKWSRETANKPNENSIPVLDGDNIYFSGVKEMAIIDRNSGKITTTLPLTGDMVHLFGSRVVPHKGNLIFPANNSLFIMNRTDGSIGSEIPVSGGTRMTPGIWKSNLLIVNQKGTLLTINPDNGSVVGEVATQALQPVAIAVSVYRDTAIFCGRKGTVSSVNLAKQSLSWERDLSGTIYHDIAVGPAGSYVFMEQTLTAMNWKDGSNLFRPVTGVSCPPLVDGKDLVYVTTGNVLIIADSASGKTRKKLQLPGEVVTRPVKLDDRIAVFSGSELLIINPEGMVQ